MFRGWCYMMIYWNTPEGGHEEFPTSLPVLKGETPDPRVRSTLAC